MIADYVIRNIGELWTQEHVPPIKGALMNDVCVLVNAFLAVQGDIIIGYGTGPGIDFIGPKTVLQDARGAVVVPGLVDGHTHLVHAGSREQELALKLAGVSYLDILKQGGGILSTVAATRKASFEELFAKAKKSLDTMLAFGVTTVEAKSGYGLNYETEKKQMLVARALDEMHPVDVVSTYLGAHALPAERAGDRVGYLQEVMRDLEKIKAAKLAESVDVFCEAGVFSVEAARTLLGYAQSLGFRIRLHAEEIVAIGGAGLAAELHAASADHLTAVADQDILALAGSDVVCDLLPGTSFYLNHSYAPARRLIAAGAAVAIASDYNPGSCPSENFQFTMQLAANQMKMTAGEVLTAATLNPAFHLGRSARIGSIAVGKQADFVLFDAPNFPYVLYHFGVNHVKEVYKNGRCVVKDGMIVREDTI